jgi:hypothetical protein
VHPRDLRRLDDELRVGVALHAGDIVADRPGEQLDVLRQVADVPAEGVGVPKEDVGAIEPSMASGRLPSADDDLAQGGLAGRGRSHDAKPFPPRARS